MRCYKSWASSRRSRQRIALTGHWWAKMDGYFKQFWLRWLLHVLSVNNCAKSNVDWLTEFTFFLHFSQTILRARPSTPIVADLVFWHFQARHRRFDRTRNQHNHCRIIGRPSSRPMHTLHYQFFAWQFDRTAAHLCDDQVGHVDCHKTWPQEAHLRSIRAA